MTQKSRGLGRGLSALLPTSREEVRSLPVGQLVPNRFQPRERFDDHALGELSASIQSQGMLQPIVVSPLNSTTYTIIAGERRWRAAQRAGLTSVPVVVRRIDSDRQLLELALIENVQRSDLNPIEEAEAYLALANEFGLSQEEIAQRVGKSRVAISNALRLLRLPEEVLELLRSGALSAGQARPLLALDDAEEIVRLARLAVESGSTARAMETLARGGGKKKRKPRAPEPNTAAAAERMTQRLQTKVEIERRGRGGVIKIHYHSEEELMRLFDQIASAKP